MIVSHRICFQQWKAVGQVERAGKKKQATQKRLSAKKKRTERRREPVKKCSPALDGRKISPRAKDERFLVVGIGASAGGLDALTAFFRAVPDDPGMAFIVVAHLAPDRPSMLPHLLGKHTRMEVCEVTDGAMVRPNRVFVVPPNRELALLHGALQLLESTRNHGVNLPVDSFFRSLARDQGPLAVAVVLSGTGSDGTLGLRAVKGEAGLVIVQLEDSARFEGMPRSAIDSGLADHVLAPQDMPAQLLAYGDHVASPSATSGITIDDDDALQKILVILRDRVGHDFSLYKKNTICRRIMHRMSIQQIDTTNEYVCFLQSSEREAGILYKDLLIGVTSFFRNPAAFDALQLKFIPRLIAAFPAEQTVRVWVPGCATGEEAYSIAILLSEAVDAQETHHTVQVFGTDASMDAIRVARAARYPNNIRADVSPQRLQRYFTEEEDGFRIRKQVREKLIFAPQNLNQDPPFTRLALISCRNVLIYFSAELQRQVLQMFHYSLVPDGLLFLGSSETVERSTNLYAQVSKKWQVYRRNPGPTPPMAPTMFGPRSSLATTALALAADVQQGARDLRPLAETILQHSGTPPCVIVDDHCRVLYVHGKIGRYLELPDGEASFDLLRMARPGLRIPLAEAIDQVAIHQVEVVRQDVQVHNARGRLRLDLTARPLVDPRVRRGMVLVTFSERASDVAGPSPGLLAQPSLRTPQQLEDELLTIKESLQTTIGELATANENLKSTNEELQSTNEELQSTNEELQSTNEELETSKEELQSLHEESVSINAELQGRIEELSTVNDDLANLFDSTNIATVFLDGDLCVRRFTPRVRTVIPLMPADIGRPIRHLSSYLADIDLAAAAARVLEDMATSDRRVDASDGECYFMRIRPYRTLANRIDGVVITFEEITTLVQAETVLLGANELLEQKVRDDAVALAAIQWDLAQMGAGRTRAEAELSQHQQLLGIQQTRHPAGDWDWDWDLTTDLLRWSPQVSAALGLDAAFAPSPQRLRELVHPDDRHLLSSAHLERMAEDGKYLVDCRINEPVARAGQHVILEGDFLYTRDGKPVRVGGKTRVETK